jgi:hypothetical protein
MLEGGSSATAIADGDEHTTHIRIDKITAYSFHRRLRLSFSSSAFSSSSSSCASLLHNNYCSFNNYERETIEKEQRQESEKVISLLPIFFILFFVFFSSIKGVSSDHHYDQSLFIHRHAK